MGNKPSFITHPDTGEIMSKPEWAKKIGITQSAFRKRLLKYPLITALTIGALPKSHLITHPKTGVTMSKYEWAEKIGITFHALRVRLEKHPIEVALTIGPLHRFAAITHPLTGETLSRTEWAEKIGICVHALSNRIKNHSLATALTIGPMPPSKVIWSKEEDDYLEAVYRNPKLYKLWNKMVVQRGWKQRSQSAISARIQFLQHKGILTSRKSLEESEGWLSMSQLAGCMGVSSDSVRHWMSQGLKSTRNGDCVKSHYKIHLKDFVIWACTLNSAPLITKAILGNELASTWLLVQLGNWIKEAVGAQKSRQRLLVV